MDVSVVLSSYNGASRRLRYMLDSLIEQTLPRDRWEVIVVDNNSTDGTFPLLSEYAPRLPLKILRHKVPGKSGAMNRALAEASGKILVFTDDDIRADPRWLEAISDCADRHPDYGLFGGCILPDWETPPTADFIKWIPMGSTFAIIESNKSEPCDATKIWGPNTFVRRSVLGDIRYREDLGPSPSPIFAMGEDQDIAMRVAARGVKCWRCCNAVVHHWIPASSVNEAWVQERAERLGYGIPALFPDRVPSGMRFLGVPLQTWLDSGYWSLRAFLLSPFGNSKLRFWAIWRSRYMRGIRAGIRRYAPTSTD